MNTFKSVWKVRHLSLSLSILLLAGLVLAAYAQKSGGARPSLKLGKNHREQDSAQIIRARGNWFYRQRAYPLPRIPAFARERAWNAMRQMQANKRLFLEQKYGTQYKQMAAAAALAANVVNTSAGWTAIGPQPTNMYFFQPYVSGRVSAMVVDPCDSTGNTVFLGGAQGGLWMTSNGGTSWTPLTDSAPSLAIGSLAVPPASAGCVNNHSATVYVGTGEQNFSLDSYYGAGVLICTTSTGTSYSCAPDKTFGAFNAQSRPLDFDAGGPYIGSLAVDPAPGESSILLAAISGFENVLPSGVYCSSDSGLDWTYVLPGGTTYNIDGTAVAFDQGGVGYAALGTIDGSGGINGVYKTASPISSCSSAGFAKLSTLSTAAGGSSAMGRIAISVYSGSSSSNDEVFAAVATGNSGLPSNSPCLYSGCLLGVFGSGDGGTTWTRLTDPHLADSAVTSSEGGFCDFQCFYDLTIEIDPRNPAVVYAGGSAPGNDSGSGTLVATSNASSGASGGPYTISGSSTWSDVSDNSCTACLTGMHVDTHAIAFTPPTASNDLVYAGTDGGAWSLTSPAAPGSSQTLADLNGTLGLTQFYAGLSNNPAGWQYRTFGGAQDNGVQVYGQESGMAWDDTLTCGDGAVTLVDPLIPSTMYAECAYIPGLIGGIVKSQLNGDVNETNPGSGNPPGPNYSFFETDNGINLKDSGSFVPPLAIDPNATGSTADAETLYFGTYRVWQTTTGGNIWYPASCQVGASGPAPCDVSGANSSETTPLPDGLTVSAFCQKYKGACTLTALGVAQQNSNEVVTGSDAGEIYLSENAGQGASATWTEVGNMSSPVTNDGPNTLPPTTVTDAAIDSNGNLYATFSGFSGTYQYTSGGVTQTVVIPAGHVFYGLVAGTASSPTVAWTDVSFRAGNTCTYPADTLPNVPVNSVVVDPDNPGQLFVGTDVGVFVGELLGTAPSYVGGCWEPLGSGLPNSAVLSLTLNNASRTLIAGTHGRSAWAYALGDQPAFSLGGLMPASADAGGNTFTLTLTGTGFTSNSKVNWTPSGGSPSSLSQTTLPSGCAGPPTCIAVSVPGGTGSGSLLGSAESVQLSVSDPSQTSDTNSLTFTVTSATTSVTSINPASGGAGSSVAMTLQGSGFGSSSTVGLQTGLGVSPCAPIAGALGSGTSPTLSATLTASCLQYGGVFFVTANNPQPGGGSSNPNLIAAASPYGGACTGMSTPGCLLAVTGAAPSNTAYTSAASVSPGSAAIEDSSGASATESGPSLASLSCGDGAPLGQLGVPDAGDAKGVWFKYTPASGVTAEIDTVGSTYDTILSVWTVSGGAGNLAPLTTAPGSQPPYVPILTMVVAVFLAMLVFRRRVPLARRLASSLAVALLAGCLASQGACGGGGGGSSNGGGGGGGGGGTPTFTNVACNDDIVSGINRVSEVSGLNLSANTTYYIMVSTFGIPILNGSGTAVTNTIADGGKTVLNLNVH